MENLHQGSPVPVTKPSGVCSSPKARGNVPLERSWLVLINKMPPQGLEKVLEWSLNPTEHGGLNTMNAPTKVLGLSTLHVVGALEGTWWHVLGSLQGGQAGAHQQPPSRGAFSQRERVLLLFHSFLDLLLPSKGEKNPLEIKINMNQNLFQLKQGLLLKAKGSVFLYH